jgi:hypothetical protein
MVFDRAAYAAFRHVRRCQPEEHPGRQRRVRLAWNQRCLGGSSAGRGSGRQYSPIRDDGPEAVRPEWIPIRPNTDTAMMLALAHKLIVERRHDEVFLGRCCSGFERVLPYLTGETDMLRL